VKPVVLPHPSSEHDESAVVWAEWSRITNFLESARISFARERQLWMSLKIVGAEDVRFRSHAEGATTHRVGIADHLAAIAAEDVLHASVLIHTYAIAEAVAAQRLDKDQRALGGIEDWGTQLLVAAGSSWDAVDDGLAGAVEVAVVRNTFAHGSRQVDRASARRLAAAGATALSEGDPVTLGYRTLKNYRRRLKLLLNASGLRRGG
jgi:hypothetical protein